MVWFNPNDWRGKEITFSAEPGVTWVLEEILHENFKQKSKDDSMDPHSPSTAWAVFLCRKMGEGINFAMKIWMQIPYSGTEFDHSEARRTQAEGTHRGAPEREIAALRKLETEVSMHSPRLLNVSQTQQGEDGPVPTGVISYVLMTFCPGVPLCDKMWWTRSLAERIEIRKAFHRAWEDAVRCSVINYAPDPADLWDRENLECYMVGPRYWSGAVDIRRDPKRFYNQ